MKKHVCGIETLMNLAYKINLRKVSGHQISSWSCVARNIQVFGRATSMAHAWWSLHLNTLMSAGELTVGLKRRLDTVQPSSGHLFKQYYFTAGGDLHQSWPATVFTFLLVLLSVLARPVVHFQFPFVQPELWPCGFRFWKGAFPETLWCTVMGCSNFRPSK